MCLYGIIHDYVHEYVGVWDMRGKQFHRGVEIHHWVLLTFAQVRFAPEDKIRSVDHCNDYVSSCLVQFLYKVRLGGCGLYLLIVLH